MKTKYKFIHFEEELPVLLNQNTKWVCRNNKTKTAICDIIFYQPWQQWVFEGFRGCVFSIDCLSDIIDFMKQL